MLERLTAAGFKLDYGDDGSGLFMKYLRRGGGYYIDVGCAALIGDGKIKIKQGAAIDRFTADGIQFADRSFLPADVIVLATGFKNMREGARAIFGDRVADRCGLVWGLDDEGELRTIWRRSGHPGFWFMGGNLHQCRHYSKFLALQIKASEEGLLDPSTGRLRETVPAPA
jgi:putative flavoprotein involved in K+ transport